MGEKKKKKKKRITISIRSVILTVIAFGQLFFTIPVVIKYFERVEMEVVEHDISKFEHPNKIRTFYTIKNIGKNTAKNVELHLRVLKNDTYLFDPKIFTLVEDDKSDGVARNLIFKRDELVENETVDLYIFSIFDEYLELNSLDTLVYNKPIERPKQSYGPHITGLKHSTGKVSVKHLSKLTLRKPY